MTISQADIDLLRLYVNDPHGTNEVFNDPALNDILAAFEEDIYGAAAECWRIKAGSVSDWYNVSLEAKVLTRAQVFDHCLKMADLYVGMSGHQIESVLMKVTDTDLTSTSEFG